MFQDDLYSLTTAPANEPIRLLEAKNFLRVEDDADDVLIESLIKTARSQGEFYTARSFVQRTFTGKFANLIQSDYEVKPFIELKKSPLISVTSVKGLVSSVLTDIAVADYYLKQTDSYSRILFITAPTVDDDTAYPLEVEFVVGYSAIPDDILTALKQHILFLYENRGDVIPDGMNSMPIVAKSIYSKHRILNIYG